MTLIIVNCKGVTKVSLHFRFANEAKVAEPITIEIPTTESRGRENLSSVMLASRSWSEMAKCLCQGTLLFHSALKVCWTNTRTSLIIILRLNGWVSSWFSLTFLVWIHLIANFRQNSFCIIFWNFSMVMKNFKTKLWQVNKLRFYIWKK